MKWIAVLTISFLPTLGFGQIESPGKLESIGLIVSPNISYRTLSFSSPNQWIADRRNSEELPGFGFMVGATIHYRITDRIRIETGILYSDMSIRTADTDLTWVTPNDAFPIQTKTVFHYGSIRVPFKVNYRLYEHNKLNVYAVMGLSTNLFINKRTEVVTEYPDRHSDSHTSSKHVGYSIFGLGLTAGAGVEYQFSRRIYSRLEPSLNYSVTSAVVDKGSKEYFYSFGIMAGFFYRFGNKTSRH